MPELPEVETIRRGIVPHIQGKRITQVLVRQPQLRWTVSAELSQSLTGQRIDSIHRRAKYLLFSTSGGRMMVHLGMSGSLRIGRTGAAPQKHDHLDIHCEDDTLLRYRDPRRFGSVFWLPGDSSHPLLDSLGPEPLTDALNGEYLYQQSRARRLAVKLFIMNSQILVGVGNIYANEALHLAGIKPTRSAQKIARQRYEVLAQCIKQVLADAIKAGGTSLQDHVREDGSPGYFKPSLHVYGRGGEACYHCGRKLKEIRLNNRTTVYCTACQR